MYDDASRKLILRFKHGDQLQAVRTLTPWLAEAGADVLASADIIMPVPLHRWRLLKRRYNQSALLARALGKLTGKTVMMHVLCRTRATPPQGYLKRVDRIENVKGAFMVGDVAAISGKTVLLIDDVFTTGATLNVCAQALMHAGAASVDVLTVARVVRDM
jgi:ComF family protein